MKKSGIFFSVIATFVVTCGLARAALPMPYAGIVMFESKRSLGKGALARYLAAPNAEVAARAALALGRTKLPGAEPLLTPHLRDKRVAVRAMTVYAIGLLSTGAQSARLLGALTDPSDAVRLAAVDALARYQAGQRLTELDRTTAANKLLQLLGTDPSPLVRARSAVALIEFRGSDDAAIAGALIGAAARDADLQVRRHAMWAVYRAFAKTAGARSIITTLHDTDEVVRIEAVRALGRFTDPALESEIRPLLDDPAWRVQEQAAETMRLLEGGKLSEHWTAIPAFVHLPVIASDPLAGLPAIAARTLAKPSAPQPADVPIAPVLNPQTAQAMTSPAHGMHPRLRIVTTKGNVYVTLFPEWAPVTVANFLNLAQRGYYDGNRWFRIVPDFVVQTGDPNDNGNGDAGYTLGAEENPLEQRSYVLSMGMNYDDKTQLPIRDSAGTQYYITLSPQYHLDRDFTVFGAVASGFDVLARLVESDRVVRVERIADVQL